MDTIYVTTQDKLRLQGILYEPAQKMDTCIVMVHGMSGNIIENYAFDYLGKELAKNNIAAIYTHNRGYSHINDIAIDDGSDDIGYKTVRIGVTYELFEESIYDIEAWVQKALSLGYKEIILLGHSLGTHKVINYYHNKKPECISKIILISPCDNVWQAKIVHGEEYEKMVNEAKENIAKGEPRKLLSTLLWDWFDLSSQTFINLFTDGCPADNMPVIRNPEHFEQLESIDIPVLTVAGEFDDVKIYDLEKELNVLKQKAINAPSFDIKYIPKANHVYDKQEKILSKAVIDWILKA